MVLDHRQHHLETIRSGIAFVISPLQYLADLPASAGNAVAGSFSTRTQLMEENEALRAERLRFQLKLQKMAALETENERLRQLLQSAGTLPEKVLIGELLAVDMDPFKRQVVLNHGSKDNVYAGQAILDAYGIMGQVEHVGLLQSTAILITDANHAVPVQVNRNGLRALALGTGEPNRLDIPNLPTNTDIQVGDLLITSGLGGRFPPGYPVGKVVSIHKDPGEPYADVIAEPTARLERSREVLLVLGTQNTIPDPTLAAASAGTSVSAPPAQTPAPASPTTPGAATAAARPSAQAHAPAAVTPAAQTPAQVPAATAKPSASTPTQAPATAAARPAAPAAAKPAARPPAQVPAATVKPSAPAPTQAPTATAPKPSVPAAAKPAPAPAATTPANAPAMENRL